MYYNWVTAPRVHYVYTHINEYLRSFEEGAGTRSPCRVTDTTKL